MSPGSWALRWPCALAPELLEPPTVPVAVTAAGVWQARPQGLRPGTLLGLEQKPGCCGFRSWAPCTRKGAVWGWDSGFWTFLCPLCYSSSCLALRVWWRCSDSSLMFQQTGPEAGRGRVSTGKHGRNPPASFSRAGSAPQPSLVTRLWGQGLCSPRQGCEGGPHRGSPRG